MEAERVPPGKPLSQRLVDEEAGLPASRPLFESGEDGYEVGGAGALSGPSCVEHTAGRSVGLHSDPVVQAISDPLRPFFEVGACVLGTLGSPVHSSRRAQWIEALEARYEGGPCEADVRPLKLAFLLCEGLEASHQERIRAGVIGAIEEAFVHHPDVSAAVQALGQAEVAQLRTALPPSGSEIVDAVADLCWRPPVVESPADDVPKLMVWTGPRNRSTLWEHVHLSRNRRAEQNPSDPTGVRVRCHHEELGNVYYWGGDTERVSGRGLERPSMVEASPSYQGVVDRICAPGRGTVDYVLAKDMAYAVDVLIAHWLLGGRAHALAAAELDRLCLDPTVSHTFLTRNPVSAMKSMHALSTGAGGTGWTEFDPAEGGFRQVRDLHYLLAERGLKTVVVDTDDLVRAPRGCLSAYCEAVGIPDGEDLYSWAPHHFDCYRAWPGWHDAAGASSGFFPWVEKPEPRVSALPPDAQEPAARALRYHEYLMRYKLVV